MFKHSKRIPKYLMKPDNDFKTTELTPVPASPGGPGFPASPGSPYKESIIQW